MSPAAKVPQEDSELRESLQVDVRAQVSWPGEAAHVFSEL